MIWEKVLQMRWIELTMVIYDILIIIWYFRSFISYTANKFLEYGLNISLPSILCSRKQFFDKNVSNHPCHLDVRIDSLVAICQTVLTRDTMTHIQKISRMSIDQEYAISGAKLVPNILLSIFCAIAFSQNMRRCQLKRPTYYMTQ